MNRNDRATIRTLNLEISRYSTQNAQLLEEVSSLQDDITAHSLVITHLKGTIADHVTFENQLQETIAELRKDLEMCQSELETTRTTLADTQR